MDGGGKQKGKAEWDGLRRTRLHGQNGQQARYTQHNAPIPIQLLAVSTFFDCPRYPRVMASSRESEVLEHLASACRPII